MKKVFNILAVSAAVVSFNVYGLGQGYSSYPLDLQENNFSTEVTGITSTGGGIGLQGRYTRKINQKMVLDVGAGLSGGERDARFFAGLDYELFPDYMEQPKISIRTTFEHAGEFGTTRNILGFAPKVSKGFSFWEHEAFPYVALPLGLNLDSDTQRNESQVGMSFGITGNLPFEEYRNILGVLEANIGVKDSYTGLFAGLSFPIN